MKNITLIALFLVASVGAFAQANSDASNKTHHKYKSKYDNLVDKWKPIRERAMNNAEKIPADLKASIKSVDDQIQSLGNKLSEFAKASPDQQEARKSTLKTDITNLKSSIKKVKSQIEKLKLDKDTDKNKDKNKDKNNTNSSR